MVKIVDPADKFHFTCPLCRHARSAYKRSGEAGAHDALRYHPRCRHCGILSGHHHIVTALIDGECFTCQQRLQLARRVRHRVHTQSTSTDS